MKDRFKREFGATIDEFMDEPAQAVKAATTTSEAGVVGEDELVLKENEEGDEELLERLMKANEAIDSLEHSKVASDLNPQATRKPNQDELLRQQVA
jgi:hypothetical protein